MTNSFTHIIPTFVTHEGYTYLEFAGEFFKGCKRCGGEGHYSHNGEHSRCYECDNSIAKLGSPLASREAAEQWCHGRALAKARRDNAAEAHRQMKVNQMNAYAKTLQAAAPDVYDFLMAVEIEDYDTMEKNAFLRSMAETLRWVGSSRLFSANMTAAVRKAMQQKTEQATEAAAHPAPTGRVAVTGTITTTKVVEGDYGTAYKIVVQDDAGFKVWVSLPKAQADEAVTAFYIVHPDYQYTGMNVWFMGSENEPERFKGIKGRRITFTATLEPSRDNVSFAFGSRPTKGAWL